MCITAAEKLGGSIIEIGAIGETIAAKFARLFYFVQARFQVYLVDFAIAISFEVSARYGPIV